MAETNQAAPNEPESNDTEQSKSKRKRVTFTKNVKFGDKRYTKGESMLLEEEKAKEYKDAGVIE